MIEQRVGQRTQYRFGVLPTDDLQSAPGVGEVNCLVTDAAQIARRVGDEQVKYLLCTGTAIQARHGGVRGGFVPAVHGFDKRAPRGTRRGHPLLRHRSHGPVSLLDVAGLGFLEIVDRPQDRQPAIRIGTRQCGQVRGVNHQHGVKLEADSGPRFNVAHSGQKQGAEHLPIRNPAAADPRSQFLDQAFARLVLQQAHQWLDLGT